MPNEVPLTFAVPECFADMPLDAFRAEVAKRLADEERRLSAVRRKSGISVVGASRLKKFRWNDVPKRGEDWFSLNPEIAAKDRDIRIAAIQALVNFRKDYRFAWEAYQDGDLDAEFPAGSWWMPRYAHCRCAPPPS